VIVASTPMRLSIAGGGTDLPEHYTRLGCELIAVAIGHRICVEVDRYGPGAVMVEVPEGRWCAPSVAGLPASLVRTALTEFGIDDGIAVRIRSGVPPGSGLGGSGAMLVALVSALSHLVGTPIGADQAARLAFHVERHLGGRRVGQQDHWTAARGGFIRLVIDRSGWARAVGEPLLLAAITPMLDRHLLLFRTPVQHDASAVLAHQPWASGDSSAAAPLAPIAALLPRLERAIKASAVAELGSLLDRHWQAKRLANPHVTNALIDDWYATARAAGALGGKLVGAGGGGHLLLAVGSAEVEAVESVLSHRGLRRIPLAADPIGVVVRADASTDACDAYR
jgi:D-glycero-alpha-D-manno-heptose-7-phosphate kinase